MPTPKKSQSKPKTGLSGTPTLGQGKSKAKPAAKEKNKKASTFSVLGRAKAGGGLGYQTAARKVIKQETKGMKPLEAIAYSEKRRGPLEKQMAAERGRTATRAKTHLKKKDSRYAATSTKQIDYAVNNKPAYKIQKKGK